MFSRIRENVQHVFDCFCEVAPPVADSSDPLQSIQVNKQVSSEARIVTKFPDSYNEVDTLRMVPMFVFPCTVDMNTVENSSFVLTSLDSKWTFGFCRLTSHRGTALVLLSALPWHNTFFKLLNVLAEQLCSGSPDRLWQCLQRVYAAPLPERGMPLVVNLGDEAGIFSCLSADHLGLPSIPHDRNLTEYFNAVGTHNMMLIFAAMLFERRIVVTSRRLSRLSACVQAANAIIYPMSWQHIFIPILPASLIEYLLVPMPFLVGVPAELMQRVQPSDLGDVVVLDADANKVTSFYDDLGALPNDVVATLKRNLRNPNYLTGDCIARCFMRALVQLIGGYREALRFPQKCSKITFDSELFVRRRPQHMKPFLEEMLKLQIFHQFISERLDMLNSGQGFSDEFEMEACIHLDKSNSRLTKQYRDWLSLVKKDGGALLKSFRNRTNPALRSAVRSVFESGKSGKQRVRMAYQDLRNRKRESANTTTVDTSVVEQDGPLHKSGSSFFIKNPNDLVKPQPGSEINSRLVHFDLIDSSCSLKDESCSEKSARSLSSIGNVSDSSNYCGASDIVSTQGNLKESPNSFHLFDDVKEALISIEQKVHRDLIRLESDIPTSEDMFDPLSRRKPLMASAPPVSGSSHSHFDSVYSFYVPGQLAVHRSAHSADCSIPKVLPLRPESSYRRVSSTNDLLGEPCQLPLSCQRPSLLSHGTTFGTSSMAVGATQSTHRSRPSSSTHGLVTTPALKASEAAATSLLMPHEALVPPLPVFRSVAVIRRRYENRISGDPEMSKTIPLPPKQRQWKKFD